MTGPDGKTRGSKDLNRHDVATSQDDTNSVSWLVANSSWVPPGQSQVPGLAAG